MLNDVDSDDADTPETGLSILECLARKIIW